MLRFFIMGVLTYKRISSSLLYYVPNLHIIYAYPESPLFINYSISMEGGSSPV